jgi:hypothetical protein
MLGFIHLSVMFVTPLFIQLAIDVTRFRTVFNTFQRQMSEVKQRSVIRFLWKEGRKEGRKEVQPKIFTLNFKRFMALLLTHSQICTSGSRSSNADEKILATSRAQDNP